MPSGGELAWYGHHFDTVEGNTTFYAVPRPETVARWAELAPPTLRLCCKLPRHITHERRLRDCAGPVAEFLERMTPLADRMGPVQIQLPPSFGPRDLPVLLEFIDDVCWRGRSAPNPFSWAVEVRHAEFSAGGASERTLNDALAERGVNRVILDSRALFAAPPVTAEEVEAQRAKPRLPVRPVATAHQPLIRLIGRSDHDASLAVWRPWFTKLGEWVAAGVDPHVFVHTPDNESAPTLANRVWNEMATIVDDLPPGRTPGRAGPETTQPTLLDEDEGPLSGASSRS
jgi:uncharacterized protein YecE (DUF72 family)